MGLFRSIAVYTHLCSCVNISDTNKSVVVELVVVVQVWKGEERKMLEVMMPVCFFFGSRRPTKKSRIWQFAREGPIKQRDTLDSGAQREHFHSTSWAGKHAHTDFLNPDS